MNHATNKWGIRAIAAAALMTATNSALAQSQATLPPESGVWLQWVVALGLAVVVLITGFLNPKRSHLT